MMRSSFDVVIAGGGLAGCAAAIQLASEGREVLVLEKEAMPRDKLCGEFLSTEVSDLCMHLGVAGRLASAGARDIRHVTATAPGGVSFSVPLPGRAMGVSRLTLDEALFRRGQDVGAVMRDQSAVRSIEGSLGAGFAVEFDGGRAHGRIVLGAYGRREVLDRRLGRTFLARTSPYVAFKAHFVGLDLQDRIELHAFPGGYCGLLTEDHGLVNACWIARDAALKQAGGSPEAMIAESFRANERLAERFAGLERTSEFHAASQLIFRRKSLFDGDVCMVGDAAGMIAPLCGDGMAMALESGIMAARAAARMLDGDGGAAAFKRRYRRAWQSRFAMRMRIGRMLHAGFVRPTVLRAGLRVARVLPSAARIVIRATRG